MDVVLDELTSFCHRAMKIINIVKYGGLAAITLLFVSLLAVGFYFEATHEVSVIGDAALPVLSSSDFNILQVNTVLVTAMCVAYAMLLLPWMLYFARIDKKSGLQYWSLYPMTGKRVGKVVAIALTILNGVTAIAFYFLYFDYAKSSSPVSSDSQLSILTLLCCAIVFWGAVYLVYGSLYGVRRFKDIAKKMRERRNLRRMQGK
jgi:hypothetical protein